MKMKHEIRERWIEALRSGRFHKITGRLGRDRTAGGWPVEKMGNCALGVLCELAVEDGVLVNRSISAGGQVAYNGKGDYPPSAVREWAGIGEGEFGESWSVDGRPIMALNDTDGLPFDEIAKAIDTDSEREFDS